MKINRKKFFANIKAPLFGGHFTQEQVNGIDALIDVIDEQHISTSHTANIFAQVYHETGRKMGPVREGFAKSDRAAREHVTKLFQKGVISRDYGKPHANGMSYYGRGPIQITHKENYAKLSPYVGVDLVASPDLALSPKIGAKIAVIGMTLGLFTGKKLSDYSGHDYFNMRSIVNGDKNKRDRNGHKMGDLIARYSREFEDALVYEKVTEPTVPTPAEPVDKEPARYHNLEKLDQWLVRFSKGEISMDTTKLYGVLRHAIGAVGAFVVGMNYATADEVGQVLTSLDALVGAAGVVAATVLSIVNKIKA